jgi:hypothetical protein
MTDPSIEAQAREAGADFFFLKPLSMPVFIDAVEKLLGVKAMTAPVPAQAEPKGSTQTVRLVELLSSLRQSLRAEQAALFNVRGRILFQDMEDGFQKPDPELLVALAESLHASNKVSRVLASKDKENVLAFRGRRLDILVTTASTGYNLLVVLQSARTTVRLAIAFDALLTARKDVQTILAEMGIVLQLEGPESGRPAKIQTRPLKQAGNTVAPPAPAAPESAPSQVAAAVPSIEPAPAPVLPAHDEVQTPPEVKVQSEVQEIPPVVQDSPVSAAGAEVESILDTANDASAVEFDALFIPKSEKKIAADEASAFWDEAVQKINHQVKTGGISYEQARQLGLTPEDLLGKE